MDNDNKIAEQSAQTENQGKLTQKSIRLFLGDELKSFARQEVELYDLESEYAKTKKNKNKSVIIWMISCFLVVAAITAGSIYFIRSSNNKIAVNIDTFDDLNLKEFLNSVGRLEALYENAVQTHKTILSEKEFAEREALQKRENDLFTLQSVASLRSPDWIAEQTKAINDEYSKTMNSIKLAYEKQISDAEERMAGYEAELSEIDQDELAQATDSEGVIDSQQLLNEFEKKSLINKYENQISDLKLQMNKNQKHAMEQQRAAVEQVRQIYQAKIDLLDPDARSQSKIQDDIIFNVGIPREESDSAIEEKTFDKNSFLSQFSAPTKDFENSLNSAEKALENIETIAGRFESIPMENSIKDYVPAIKNLATELASSMAEGGSGMQKEIDSLKLEVASKNSEIKELENMFENLCVQNAEDVSSGIVLDASNKQRIVVYIAKSVRSRVIPGAQVEAQIRDGKKVLASVFVTESNGKYYALQNPNVNSKTAITAGQKLYFPQ